MGLDLVEIHAGQRISQIGKALGQDPMVMDDRKRVPHDLHVEQGQRTEGAAHQIEAMAPGCVLQPAFLDPGADGPGDLLRIGFRAEP